MTTATKRARATSVRADHATNGVPSGFLVFQSNGGDYRWTIESADGTTLARSGSFTSFEDAEQAAIRVRDGAAATQVQGRTDGESPSAVA